MQSTKKKKIKIWHEKSTKFFYNLEKHRAIQSQIHFVIINQDEITDQDKINKQPFYFYQSLFWCKVTFRNREVFRKHSITKTHLKIKCFRV